MLRSWASFRGNFPKDHADNEPPGKPLADLLADSLGRSGVVISGRDSTDYSHVFGIHAGDQRFSAGVGLVDDDDREWLLYIVATTNWLSRLFGKRDEQSHRIILRSVHEALSADRRVSGLRWYTEYEWNTNPSGGVSEPDAST